MVSALVTASSDSKMQLHRIHRMCAINKIGMEIPYKMYENG